MRCVLCQVPSLAPFKSCLHIYPSLPSAPRQKFILPPASHVLCGAPRKLSPLFDLHSPNHPPSPSPLRAPVQFLPVPPLSGLFWGACPDLPAHLVHPDLFSLNRGVFGGLSIPRLAHRRGIKVQVTQEPTRRRRREPGQCPRGLQKG